ncbi:basic region leucin zipper protein [Mycena sanguinolenta]|nr:basic region leucin zipper protein [Mycena sanguinolenta]
MPRGRKKDLTIPANRALALQRDYRERKARYIADLEARCTAAEAENVRLRQEIALLRAQSGGPSSSPQAIQASVQLRDALAAASASLAYFTGIALPAPADGTMAPPSSTADAKLPQRPNDDNHVVNSDSIVYSGPARPESPCCGGFLDCEGLVEEDEDDDIAPVSLILPTSYVR